MPQVKNRFASLPAVAAVVLAASSLSLSARADDDTKEKFAAVNTRVTAVDGSRVAIDLLLARAQDRKVSIDARTIDLEAGEFEIQSEAYDLVLSCYYLQRSLISGMKSAIRPGGLLIMIVHLADADLPDGTPTRAYPSELRVYFEGWRILHYREGEPGESGHRHAVAEVVAQRPD